MTQGGNVLHLVAGPVTLPAWSYVLSLSTFREFYQCSPKGFPKRYEVDFLMLGFQTQVMREMWWSWPVACSSFFYGDSAVFPFVFPNVMTRLLLKGAVSSLLSVASLK